MEISRLGSGHSFVSDAGDLELSGGEGKYYATTMLLNTGVVLSHNMKLTINCFS